MHHSAGWLSPVVLDCCLCCLQISRCTCGCRIRCGPVAHQQHGSVATDKLSEDENDVTGLHYGVSVYSFHCYMFCWWCQRCHSLHFVIILSVSFCQDITRISTACSVQLIQGVLCFVGQPRLLGGKRGWQPKTCLSLCVTMQYLVAKWYGHK